MKKQLPKLKRSVNFMKLFSFFFIFLSCTNPKQEFTLKAGDIWLADGEYSNFVLQGEAYTEKGAESVLLFHTDGEKGYEVVFHNGDIDGTLKTGSLTAIRNLYHSLAEDNQWFDFEIAVRKQNVSIKINGTDVV